MIELEDSYVDIILKAMRGAGITKKQIAKKFNIEHAKIKSLLSGQVNVENIILIAGFLGLDAGKLIYIALNKNELVDIKIPYLRQFNLPYGEMLVNSYIIWEQNYGIAWIFDTGPDAKPIIEFLIEKNLRVDGIFLTHTHRDHIACLDELREKVGNPSVYVHQLEFIDGCEAIEEGFKDSLGSLSLETRHTHGHSVGGITYIISGLPKKLAIVGDAIFAGSMGGGMVSYEDALRTNREKIMTLPDETVLCPGHGPITTVKEEKTHNPFFPEF